MRGETVVTATRQWGGKAALTRPVGWLDARDLVGRPGKLPLSGRREMRVLVGMRLRPEEDALDAVTPISWVRHEERLGGFRRWMVDAVQLTRVRGQLDWRDRVKAVGSP